MEGRCGLDRWSTRCKKASCLTVQCLDWWHFDVCQWRMLAYLIAMESEMNDVSAPTKRKVSFLLWIGILLAPMIFVWFLLRKGHSTLSRLIGFAWLVISFMVVFAFPETGTSSRNTGVDPAPVARSTAAAPAAPAEKPKAYLASQVAAHYDENTISADMLFKGKRVIVGGHVTAINTDFLGNPYLVLAGTNKYSGPQFKFPKTKLTELAAVKKGADVYVICTGAGDIAKTPMFEDCEMAP